MRDENQTPDIYVGEVRGIRRFRIDGEGLAPVAVRRSPFQPGVNTADCRSLPGLLLHHRQGRKSPVKGCSCGFYAYYGDDWDRYQHLPTIQGIVEAWGTIISGNNGFRAEKMRLVALVHRPFEPPRIREVGGMILPGDGVSIRAAGGASLGLFAGMGLVEMASAPSVGMAAAIVGGAVLAGGGLGHLHNEPSSALMAASRAKDEELATRYGVPLYEDLSSAKYDFPVAGRPDHR